MKFYPCNKTVSAMLFPILISAEVAAKQEGIYKLYYKHTNSPYMPECRFIALKNGGESWSYLFVNTKENTVVTSGDPKSWSNTYACELTNESLCLEIK